MTIQPVAKILLISACLFTLAACGRSNDATNQTSTGTSNATTMPSTPVPPTATSQSAASAERSSGAVSDTAAQASSTMDDAAITTSINAGLAKDSDLSAFKIDVDTKAGKVSLHGSAPTTQARDRAVTIAQSVKGVTGVDNQLTIKEKS